MHVTRRTALQLALGAVPVLARCAWSQPYPIGPTRLVVGFPPGGPTDATARFMAQALSTRFGAQIIVENRPGAGSNIATAEVAHGPADGSTLLLVTTTNAISATLYRKLDFNFIGDIAPVASVSRYPLVMVVNPSVPADSVPRFIAYAKANPGKVNMGSGSSGSPFHVAGELFKMMTGVDMLHVPYRGSASMLAAMLAGQVQAGFDAMSSSMPYIKAGKLRALGVTTADRSPALPDLPTIGEFVSGYEASGWNGIGAPRDTPARIVEHLNQEINLILADPERQMQFAKIGATVFPQSPVEFGNFITAETAKWAKVVKFSGATVD